MFSCWQIHLFLMQLFWQIWQITFVFLVNLNCDVVHGPTLGELLDSWAGRGDLLVRVQDAVLRVPGSNDHLAIDTHCLITLSTVSAK